MDNLDGLKRLFEPTGIALIGASARSGAPGYEVLKNIKAGNFKGQICPVNPKAEEILGSMVYPSIQDLPSGLDLAIIIVPAKAVPESLTQCSQKGIKAAIIMSSGFAELGESGRALQANLVEIARREEITLLGPNSLGIYNGRLGLNLTMSGTLESVRDISQPGAVAFISQSGAFGLSLLAVAIEQGLGCSKFISLGNKSCLNDAEVLHYLNNDPETKIIMMYIEDVKDGKEFMAAAKAISPSKPIVAAKIGRSQAGARAVASHTGALAGSDRIYEAAFRQSGVLRARSAREMLDISKALSWQPRTMGGRVAIITNSGGMGSEFVDYCVDEGLEVPELSAQLKDDLGQIVPEYCSKVNPIDLAAPDPNQGDMYFRTAIKILASDEIDGLAIIMVGKGLEYCSAKLHEYSKSLRDTQKPMVVCGIGRQTQMKEMFVKLQDCNIPAFEDSDRAARCLRMLCSASASSLGRREGTK